MDNLFQPERPTLDVVDFVWRHRIKMFLTLVAGLALTLAYFAMAARTYESEAKLLVRLGRESITLDPTATTGQFVAMAESREHEMHSVEELLTSRATAEAVVDQFGPGVILERKTNGPRWSDRLAWLEPYNLNPLKVYSLRDKAVKAIGKNLGVSVGKKSNVLTVSYQSEDPQLARDVLDALLKTVREEHVRVHRTRGSQEFFVAQRDQIRVDLARQEEALRIYKDQHGLATLPIQRDAQVGLIAALEADYLRAKAEQSAAQAEVELRRKQLRDQPMLVVTEQTTGQPQTLKQTLREKLYELELREQEFAARLKDTAPQLQQIRSQIAESRRIARNEQVATETKKGVNQAHQATELALQEREAQLVALVARTQSLEEKIATTRDELKKLNAAEMELTRQERELEMVRGNYRKYSENLEQARIDQELEVAKISSLNLMQPPSLAATPVSPQPIPTLAFGFFGAIVASFGVALFAETRPKHRSVAASLSPQHLREPATLTAPPRSLRGEVVPANPR